MSKILAVLFFALFAATRLDAQLLPKEGSALNYRLIGFSFSPSGQKSKYKIEIAMGNHTSEDSFMRNIVVSSAYNKDTKIIIEVPFFGRQYTWRVVTAGENAGKEQMYHFSTTIVNDVDTSITRLRILQKTGKYKDAYVFLDGTRALYDMNGQPVWYLPDIDGYSTEKSLLRDLKLTPRGTITFLFEERAAYEVNYDAAILWKAPNDGKVNGQEREYYHHEFTRLGNGHYMALGSESVLWNQHLPSATDSSFVFVHTNKRIRDSGGMKGCPFGTLIEYDEMGNVVWSWKSSEYFKRSDIYYHKAKSGKPEIPAHANSFYFDEKEGFIYVGFRNISRILKIKYPEGKVLAGYGEIYKPDSQENGNGLFCRQHNVRRSADGYLYLFNNNVCASGSGLPQVLKLEEGASDNKLRKIWEYDCTTEGAPDNPQGEYQFPTGGNVVELPDGSLFINMSTIYSKVFMLSEDKKILWSAIPEKKDVGDKSWRMVYDYRASLVINARDMEKLIWNAEINSVK